MVFLGAIVVSSVGQAKSSCWTVSWGLMITTGILLAVDLPPVFGEVARFSASFFAGLQLAGAYRFVGKAIPLWVFPVAAAIGIARCAVALSGFPELSHASVLVFEIAVLGWSGRVVLERSPRDRMDWLLALGALTLCGLQAMDAVNDISKPDGTVMWAPWLVLGAAVGMLQTLGVNERILRASVEKRRESEEKQRTAQRLESLGVLAGGIAHDFNNLLAGILGNSELALLELEESHPARASVEQAVEGAMSAAELAGQMLAYASGQRLEPQPVDLSRMLKQRSSLLRSAVSSKVRLAVHAPEDLPHVLADPTQLEQVILNLAINAGEACDDAGGVVGLELTFHSIEGEAPAVAIGDLEAGRYLRLSVTDNGNGLGVQPVSRIFDPFFSTKFSGRGMGLAVTQQIVRAHGGAIGVESGAGGSRFDVYLPVPDEALEELAKPALPLAAPSSDARILVVDDDERVLRVLGRALSDAGHAVIMASGGREAIDFLGDAELTPALLLLDATMPDVGARDVIEFVHTSKPDLPILMMTGHDTERLAVELDAPSIAGWIRKPFRFDALHERIAEVLRA